MAFLPTNGKMRAVGDKAEPKVELHGLAGGDPVQKLDESDQVRPSQTFQNWRGVKWGANDDGVRSREDGGAHRDAATFRVNQSESGHRNSKATKIVAMLAALDRDAATGAPVGDNRPT